MEFCGGLAAFIFGMRTLSGALSLLAGGRAERILSGLTKSPLRAGLLGAAASAAVQSSSAVTLLVIGMAEAGGLGLAAAGYILLGANVGTTVTPWLFSLAGIRGAVSPASLAPAVALLGAGLLILGAKGRKKSLAEAACGFGVLMLGMERMQAAVAPLRELPEFAGAVELLASPALAAAAAALFTALIQSSTASIGILQALSRTGMLPLGTVIAVVLGQNVGTCITGELSALGGGRAARAVARFNLRINVIGAAAGVVLLYAVRALWGGWLSRPAGAADIALCHSLFNILSAVLLWPAVPLLVGEKKGKCRNFCRRSPRPWGKDVL